MTSKYGGIPVDSGSKFGGVPVGQEQEEKQAGYGAGLFNQFGQGLTFGFSDEVAAGLAALAAGATEGRLPTPGSPLGQAEFLQNYQDMVAPMRESMGQFAQENPIASTAANLTGGLATGGVGLARAGAALAPRGAGAARSVLTDIGVAAGEGALAGAGYAEPGQTLQGAGMGGAGGAAVGAVAGPAIRWFSNKSAVKDQAQKALEAGRTDSVTARYILDGKNKIKEDKNAIAAISNGFDEGVVANVKGASKTDKQKMLRMVNILKRGRNDRRYAALNRPSDVVGKSIGERFNRVLRVNQAAGRKLDDVAQTLKGRPVDYDPAVNQFLDDLDKIGVKFDDANATVSFGDSDIEGAEGAISLISKLVNRARNIKEPDAYKIHRLKRFIDEQVSYGKTAEGLTGKSEVIVKRFRHNLDKALDSKFPNYRMVNEAYADSVGVIDDLQRVAGQRMDLTGPNADKAVGTLSRRVLSKAQSRVNLIDSLNDLERVATKYGGKYDDDILTQVIFYDELEGLFGSSARTSFQGEIEKATKAAHRATTREGWVEGIGKAGQRVADSIRGKTTEELALESIRRLLHQTP